jgi:hypothetical protein
LSRWRPEFDLILARFHKAGQTDYQITSNMLDLELPVAQSDVVSARRRMKLDSNRVAQHGERQQPTPNEKPNPIAIAQVWLGSRLQERPSGYWLDGIPVSLKTIMRETNRLLVASGCDQIASNPVWVV